MWNIIFAYFWNIFSFYLNFLNVYYFYERGICMGIWYHPTTVPFYENISNTFYWQMSPQTQQAHQPFTYKPVFVFLQPRWRKARTAPLGPARVAWCSGGTKTPCLRPPHPPLLPHHPPHPSNPRWPPSTEWASLRATCSSRWHTNHVLVYCCQK